MGFDGSPDTDFPVDQGRYIGVDDQIMVLAVANAATQSISVRGRLCRKNGILIPFAYQFTTGAAGAVLTKTFQLAEGFLESLQVSSPACATAGQWLYASVGLQRGTGAGAAPYETLFADYVGSVFSRSWPGAVPRMPTEGPGTLRSIGVSTPAAGAEWSIAVPAGRRWKLHTVTFVLTTSSATGGRLTSLQITDGTNELAEYAEGFSQDPSIAMTYYYTAVGAFLNGVVPKQSNPIDVHFPLEAGYTIGSIVDTIDTADQFSAIRLCVLEWAAMQ